MVGEPSLQILNKLQGLTSDKRSTVQAQYRQQLYPAHVRTLVPIHQSCWIGLD